MIRGIRGAIDVPQNDGAMIREATGRLLSELSEANGFRTEDIAGVLFTATPDLDAEYPARAARDLGWTDVPLLCAQEIAKPDGLPRTIRVLVTVETALRQNEIVHLYLGGTACLRPDKTAKRP